MSMAAGNWWDSKSETNPNVTLGSEGQGKAHSAS